ncbi:serine hydrolase domain-containing protein [Phenylobacterium sp.]|uniref:serine hydrolase domain-containing protein n=1 Tax=Phenylobacterium sp. TaxID=1871053 RepID=UPI002F40102D
MAGPHASRAYAEIDAIYGRFASEVHAPGLVAGVVREGRLDHLVTVGVADRQSGRPVTADTAFRIASMTKNVTALAILMLRDAGRLSLEAPIGAYVPELADQPLPTSDSAPVTVRDVLTHVGGFVSDDPWADRVLGMAPSDFTSLLGSDGLFAQAPGVAFEYSNLGYALLGRAITNVSGRPYQEAIGELLLAPLGLTDTTFDVSAIADDRRARGYHWRDDKWGEEPAEPDGEFAAMGGLVTTARDYGAYLAFLLNAWPPRDAPETGPARRSTRRELGLAHAMPGPARPRKAVDGSIMVATAYGYGLNSSADPLLGRCLHHSGGLPGFGSNVLFGPDAGVGVFAFANITYAGPEPANFEAAGRLHAAGLWRTRAVPVSIALRAAAKAVEQAYAVGQLDDAKTRFALNLLLDEPLASRNASLAKLRSRFGDGRLSRIEVRHALAGEVHLTCERGAVICDLVLTPGPDPKIQTLRFEAG